MATSSLRLLIECETKGLLTKEGAQRVLKDRGDLVKQAMIRQAHKLVESMLAFSGQTKEAGPLDFLRRAKSIKRDEGLVSKLKRGGFTGEGEHHGWADVGLNLTKMLGLAGLTAGATAGAGAIVHHSRDKKLQKKIQESYTQMFSFDPREGERLKAIQEERPGTVERNFNIMAKFAPSLAAEPSVAATWVRAVSHKGQIDPAEIRSLAEIQRKIDEMHEGRHGGPKLAPLGVDRVVSKAMGG